MEPITKLDAIFHLDHVSAHRILNSNRSSKQVCNKSLCNKNMNSLSGLRSANPLPSKLYFYNIIKQNFAREPYLDCSKGFSRRSSTTQLRISAYDLNIERGRYSNTPRDQRVCQWCNTSMGMEILECENNLIFDCDMYATLRDKLISFLVFLVELCRQF